MGGNSRAGSRQLLLLASIYSHRSLILKNKNKPPFCTWEPNLHLQPWMGFPSSSVGKEYTCNAGDTGLIPGLERFAGEGIGYPLQYSWASLVAHLVKESVCNAGHLGSIPGLGRSPGEGNGYPLQYSGLENSMACIVHGVAKSRTRLSHFTFTYSPSVSTLFKVFIINGC